MRKRRTAGLMLTVVAVVGLAGCTTSAVVTTSPGPTGRESIAPSPVLSDPSAPHAVCIDQLGDVTGLDLALATLTLEGASLDFTVTTATPPQGHAAYDVELVDRNAQPLYNFSIVLDAGTTTFAGTDFATNATFTLATPPRLSGDTVFGEHPAHRPPAPAERRHRIRVERCRRGHPRAVTGARTPGRTRPGRRWSPSRARPPFRAGELDGPPPGLILRLVRSPPAASPRGPCVRRPGGTRGRWRGPPGPGPRRPVRHTPQAEGG